MPFLLSTLNNFWNLFSVCTEIVARGFLFENVFLYKSGDGKLKKKAH